MTHCPDPSRDIDFSAFLAVLPHAYVVLSRDGDILAANDSFLRITMTRRDAIVGRPLVEVFADAAGAARPGASTMGASVRIAAETGRRHDVWMQKFDIPRAADRGGGVEERYLNVSTLPVVSAAGEISCIVQSIEDVTEGVLKGRAAEDRFRAVEQRLEATFEQHAVGIAHIAPDGRIVHANARFGELLGYGAAEMRTMTMHAITHPDDVPASLRLADALVAGKVPHYTIEKRYLRRDGSALWVSTSRSLVRNAAGDPEFFVAVVEDISARKAAEAALVEREADLRSILETIPDGMILIDQSGRIQSFSRTAERLFGYRADEVIGRNVSLLMPSGDRERHDSYMHDYMETGVPRIIGIGRVVTGLRKDGSTFSLHLSVGEIAATDRRVFMGFIRDLTERQESEAKLRELQSELVHISRFTALGEMASALAHELNQPLTAVTNYLKGCRRLLDQGIDGRLPLLSDAVEQAAQQALRAGQIIRRLRDFVARGESERCAEPLSRLIEEASALALVGAAERGVRVSFDFDAAAPVVYADRIQIQQVLVNLIRNAIEAMQDAPRRRLKIATRRSGPGMVEISVRDTGTGLAPEVAGHLFQPFVTTKPTGMGVGLSICRTIVEAHEGKIVAATNSSGGTTFRFTLRAANPEDPFDGG